MRAVPDAGRPPSPGEPVGIYDAVKSHWGLVLLPVLLLCAAAVAIGLHRAPKYHAEARLNVGGFNITTQAVPGFAGGAIQLATAYSRAVYSPAVLNPVSKRTHRTLAHLMSEVSASPVADSPIIRVDASSKDRKETIEVANATAREISLYATRLARSNPDSKRLLKKYLEAVRQRRAARRKHGADSTEADLAVLRTRTLASLYGQSLGGQASTNVVQVLAPALTASSDRGSVLQRLIAGALLGGLAIGVLLAVLIARSAPRRRPVRQVRSAVRPVRGAPRSDPLSRR